MGAGHSDLPAARGRGGLRAARSRGVGERTAPLRLAASLPAPVLAAVPVTRLERQGLARVHESTADSLAQRGDWQGAYQHLRRVVELLASGADEPAGEPEELRREVERLRREHAEAREQSLRDSLTTSYNRRYLDERLATVLAAGACVALADIDLFKQVNDAHGHLVGDRVLRTVVTLLTADLPEAGFCARYGGEEFALVLPGASAAQAVAVCEAARRRIHHHPWQEFAAGLRVTVSIGVGQPGGELSEADDLLYAAKHAGRNAVAFRDPSDQRWVRLAGSAGRRRILRTVAS